MPPYSWIHLENVYWVLAGGAIFAAAIVLARATLAYTFSFRKKTDAEIEKSAYDFGDGVKEYNRPVPIFIWLVGIGYFIWAALYVVFSGIRGLG